MRVVFVPKMSQYYDWKYIELNDVRYVAIIINHDSGYYRYFKEFITFLCRVRLRMGLARSDQCVFPFTTQLQQWVLGMKMLLVETGEEKSSFCCPAFPMLSDLAICGGSLIYVTEMEEVRPYGKHSLYFPVDSGCVRRTAGSYAVALASVRVAHVR